MHRILLAACFAASAATFSGCNNDTEDPSGHCGQGFVAVGPACTPVFDSCGEDEVPTLGGGCKRVGVAPCEEGIAVPPDWSCRRVGRPESCRTGWERATGGWCEPILPSSSCAAGEMERIGERSCQPVGDCGNGTWGSIATSAETIYVDRAYLGGGSDGSQGKPFTTIGGALAAAASGAQIAVAEGRYEEDLRLDKPVTLEGRCARLVTIAGQGVNAHSAVEVAAGPSVLRGVTVNGPKEGVSVDSAALVVEAAIIDSPGDSALVAVSGADLTVRRSLLQRGVQFGLLVEGAKAQLEGSVIREGQPRSDGRFGTGIQVSGSSSRLSLSDSLVLRNSHLGIAISGAQVTLEGSVVSGTLPQASDKKNGTGIVAMIDGASPAVVTLQESLVADNSQAGISISGSELTLDRSVVRDTRPRALDQTLGSGIQAVYKGRVAKLVLRDSAVVANTAVGIAVAGAEATLERSLVLDTLPQASDKSAGAGIQVTPDPNSGTASKLSAADCVISGNRSQGLALTSSDAILERTIIRDTLAQESDRSLGIGARASAATLTLRDCLVSGNRTLGVGLNGADATIERTILRGTLGQSSDGLLGFGLTARHDGDSAAKLTMTDCVVDNNTTVGVHVSSSTATLERVVVRDTQPEEKTSEDGIGLVATGTTQASELTLRGCSFLRNRAFGLLLIDSKGALERSVVSQTQPQVSGQLYGNGIAVAGATGAASLSLSDSLIDGSVGAGLNVQQAAATVNRCVVRGTAKSAAGFGDGIQVGGAAGPSLDIEGSVVEDSARAGLLFVGAGGSVSGSVIRRGVIAIDLEQGSAPEIAADNVYEENDENGVVSGQGLAPAPLPELPSY